MLLLHIDAMGGGTRGTGSGSAAQLPEEKQKRKRRKRLAVRVQSCSTRLSQFFVTPFL